MTLNIFNHTQGWGLKNQKGICLTSPAHRPLYFPTPKMAEKARTEWLNGTQTPQGKTSDLLRYVYTVIDQIAPDTKKYIQKLLEYAAYDALSIRALSPASLKEKQNLLWQPWMDWIEQKTTEKWYSIADFSTPFQQNPQALLSLGRLFSAENPWSLLRVGEYAVLFDSTILALAVKEKALSPQKALEISNLEENFQIKQWGEDEEILKSRGAQRTKIDSMEKFSSFIDNS